MFLTGHYYLQLAGLSAPVCEIYRALYCNNLANTVTISESQLAYPLHYARILVLFIAIHTRIYTSIQAVQQVLYEYCTVPNTAQCHESRELRIIYLIMDKCIRISIESILSQYILIKGLIIAPDIIIMSE